MPKSFKRFPWIRQHDTMQCGATYRGMVAKYFGLKIVVLEDGKIVETSTHEELPEKKSAFFDLVRNQIY